MISPRMPIRRFDVFAEYNREEAIDKGMPPDEAAGYGLWVAKVVASRRFGGNLGPQPPKGGEHAEGKEPEEKPKWHSLGGQPQTDKLFYDEIVKRMGPQFYKEVFEPAIREAIANGKSYTSIRDTIRRDWKPQR